MGDDMISLSKLAAFYTRQLYYTIAVSVLLTFFILPEFGYVALDLFRKVFVEKRFRVVVFLLCVGAVVRYLFRSNDEEEDLPDLHFQPVYHPEEFLPDLQFQLPDLPLSDSDPPSPVDFPASSSPTPQPSSPVSSSRPSSPVSSSPTPVPSSPPFSSPAHSSPRSPPPPPFKMKAWKVFTQGDYAWMASDVSVSSDSSDQTDVDTKAERFIAQFRRRLKYEKRKIRMAKK